VDWGLALGLTAWPALHAFDAALRHGDPAAIIDATRALSAALVADAAAPTRAAATLSVGGPGIGRGRVPSVAARNDTAADPTSALARVLRRDKRDRRAVEALLRAGQASAEADTAGLLLAFASALPAGERTRRVILGACSAVGTLAQTQAVVEWMGGGGGGGGDGDAAADGAAALLKVAARAGDAASVASVAATLVASPTPAPATTSVMNATLAAWVRVGDGEAAFTAYVACRRAGARPDSRTLNALIRAARAAGRFDRVRRLWARALVAPGAVSGNLPLPDRYTRAAVLAAAGAAAAGADDSAAPGTSPTPTPPPPPPSAAWLLSVYADGALLLGLPPCPLGVAALAYAMRGAAGRAPEHVAAVFAAAAELRSVSAGSSGDGAVLPWAAATGGGGAPSSTTTTQQLPDRWVYAELMHLAAAAGEADRAVPLYATAISREAGLGDPDPHLYSALAKCVAAGGTPELLDLGDAARRSLAAQWRRAARRQAAKVDRAAREALHRARAGWRGGPEATSTPPPAALLRAQATLEAAKAAAASLEHDYRVAHNALLHALASCGRASSAKALFGGMLTHGPRPDLITFNAAIDAAAQVGDADAAFDLYTAMCFEAAGGGEAASSASPIVPDIETYGALMHACARSGRAADAEAVLAAARAAGVPPTVQLYTSLAAAAVAAGDTDRAFAAVEELAADGLAPTGPTYGVLLAACEARGDVDTALTLYRRAIADRVRPTDEAHNNLMAVCAGAGRFGDALDLVKSLVSAGSADAAAHPADAAVRGDALNSAARALAGAGFIDRAVRVTALLRASAGPGAPTPDTLSAVMAAAARGGRLATAEAFAAELAGRGVAPSRGAASDLIVALCGAGRLKDALAVYARLVRGEALLAAVEVGGGVAGVGGGPAGAPPASTSLARWASSSTAAAAPAAPIPQLPARTTHTTPRVRPAASTRTRRAAGSVAAAPALAALVAALATAGDLDGALRLYEALRRRGLSSSTGARLLSHPPTGAWEAIIEAACRADRPADALQAFDDWRGAADAAAAFATTRPDRIIPRLSPAVLAYLEACLRSVSGDPETAWRVYDVLAAMRTQAAREAEAARGPAPAKASHHVRPLVGGLDDAEAGGGQGGRGMGQATVSGSRLDAVSTPVGPAAAAAAARRAFLLLGGNGGEGGGRRAAEEAEAARLALRARLAARQASRDGAGQAGLVRPPPWVGRGE